MKKNLKIFTVVYLGFLFLTTIISCVDCGPFPDKYNVTSFNWNVSNVEFVDDYYISANITSDEVNYANFGIIVTAETEEYYSKVFSLSLIEKAYACDPVPSTTDDKITNIEVFVNQDFNMNYSSGSKITEKFKLGFINENDHFQIMNLVDYIQLNYKVNRRDYILLLNDTPLVNGDFTFTIKITMEGKALDYFEFTTNPMTITNN